MIYEDALSAVRRYVAEAFKAGTSTFPHYTLHGAEHLEELDRLALLIGGFIPGLTKERLDLLRLAIILHDFSMVDVPDKVREAELRQQMDPDTTFADLVRKTHQDEIERSFAKPERIALLQGLLPTAGAQILEDACTIARHHRFHPLDQAPEYVQDLCALMRILDELDIGPKRAPQPAYDALRPNMDEISRFHWLKHLCTRPVDKYGTFSVEERNNRRVLKVFVAVKATERTWRPLQEKILSKLKECLEKEGVNAILRAVLHVEFELAPAPEPQLSGVQSFLAATVKEDLDNLSGNVFLSKSSGSHITKPREPFLITPAVVTYNQERSTREFKVIALPPEALAKTLCISGRLTVIGNTYIAPGEDIVGGVPGAPNRIYVGPADSGKTRAALEWVQQLTEGMASQWVVLRTGMGTLPERVEDFVLDTSHYEEQGYLLPQKAVLFLDDLPIHLPPPGAPFSADDAISTLFRWFQGLSYFRERRLVGTIRLEDTHARPEWPEILPSLGQPLEMLRIRPLDDSGYSALWSGMASGAVSRSSTGGVEPFQMVIADGFLESVIQQKADPEAVAVFVQQNAMKDRTALLPEDAERFSSSAVGTWLRESWPALLGAYGVAGRVFVTLARFFEAGIRPTSGSLLRIGPLWQAHEAFGPEICVLHGGVAESYVPLLTRLLSDGQASGEHGQWIRPKFDFLLQAADLPGVELVVPPVQWFTERIQRLPSPAMLLLAAQLATGQSGFKGPHPKHLEWLKGWGSGLLLKALLETVKENRTQIFIEAAEVFRAACEVERQDSQSWYLLGMTLDQQADAGPAPNLQDELRQQAIDAYRKATDADPKNSQAWTNLGIRLGQQADQQQDEQLRQTLRDQEIDAYRKATDADPKNSQAWTNLGIRLGQQADQQQDEQLRQTLRDQEIDAYRKATDADPNNSQAWYNLGVSLSQQADQQQDEQLRQDLRDQAIDTYRRATDADPNDAQAWDSLSNQLILQGHSIGQPECWERALEAARKSASLGGRRYNLACALALTGNTDEALSELQGCLSQGEISLEHVKQDSDWTSLREDPRFQEILRAAEEREGSEGEPKLPPKTPTPPTPTNT